MLAVDDRVPSATVFTTFRQATTVADLVADGPILLLFYLFDWSGT